MMTILTYDTLSKIREKYKDKKIVFCSGTFDLTHAGHVLFLEDCKKIGDVVVAMIGNDYLIQKYKGKDRPIQNEHIRLKMIDSLKPVDYCFLGILSEKDVLTSHIPIFQKLKPDIWAINEEAFDIEYRKEISAQLNIELKILERNCPENFENISTSKIIDKIKQLQ